MTPANAIWLHAFQGAVRLYGGIRKTGRMLGVSPSTISRLNRGDAPDPKTAASIGPKLGVCPCCGQDWPTQ